MVDRLDLNGFSVDFRVGVVRARDGVITALQPRLLNVLRHLAAHPGTAVTKDELLSAGWPDRPGALELAAAFDDWLRDPGRRFNPGTTADLVTAALYAALRDGTIDLPRSPGSWDAFPT